MKTTDSGLLCTLVVIVALIVFALIMLPIVEQALTLNPGIQQLMHVLGG